jgi:polyhydroxybutyrate depolymerase
MLKCSRYSIFLIIILSLLSGCLRKDKDPQVDNVYRFDGTVTIDGRTRTYLLNLPPDYYEGNGFSLVVAMHGGGGDAVQFESTSLLTEKANAASFIVAYPNGVKSDGLLGLQTWNAGRCCDYARDHNIDDVNFINKLIDLLISTYKINPRKVYATGHSNGGMLSYRLACELSDKIAAIAVNSCTLAVTEPCQSARPVPILHMHSVLDEHVPYQGGIGVSGIYYPPVDSGLNVWSLNNACAVTAQVLINNAQYKFTKWSDCSDQVSIEYYLTQDGGHGWPGGLPGGGRNSDTPSKVISANDLLWEFFQRYQLP